MPPHGSKTDPSAADLARRLFNMPRFADILSEAEAIAVEYQEYEVADAIAAEEPRRYGIVRKLGHEREAIYDNFLRAAYYRLLAKEIKKDASTAL